MRSRPLGVALLLVLAACSTPTATDAPTSDAPVAETLPVNLSDFMIDPSDLEVAGPTVTIDVTSDGPTPHNLTVRDSAGEVVMATTEDLSTGDAETISADLVSGEYTIFCALAGHESLGMSGTLTVTAP